MSEDEPNYSCTMCDSEAELCGMNGHWLQLYCEEFDIKFERAAYSDMNGVSIEDLRSMSDFTESSS